MGHAHLSPARDQSEGNPAYDPGWQSAAEAYLQGLADSGNFPNLAAFGAAGLLHGESTSSLSRPGSTGSSPASPRTPKQSPSAAPTAVPGASRGQCFTRGKPG